uniref:Uncharacterized protein n=1 Tax=Panstrongylus lignarius TaxID=156445 RepID=A0A224Y437_9HEMI
MTANKMFYLQYLFVFFVLLNLDLTGFRAKKYKIVREFNRKFLCFFSYCIVFTFFSRSYPFLIYSSSILRSRTMK